MKRENKVVFETLLILIISVISATTIIYFGDTIFAQTPSEEKTFTRCDIDTSLLDSMNLSYDVACANEYITIHNWERISALNKTAIITDMATKRFVEQPIVSEVNEIK